MKNELTDAQIAVLIDDHIEKGGGFYPFARAVIAADRAQRQESDVWSCYVASMVEAYLQSEPSADKREAAIAGIIGRRLWALSSEHDRAQRQAEQDRSYISPVRTVADLANNLLTMDQTLPIYGAQYIDHPTRGRCAIAVSPTLSRERVKDERWIGAGDDLNAAVVWTRAPQPATDKDAEIAALYRELREVTAAALAERAAAHEALQAGLEPVARVVHRAIPAGHGTPTETTFDVEWLGIDPFKWAGDLYAAPQPAHAGFLTSGLQNEQSRIKLPMGQAAKALR